MISNAAICDFHSPARREGKIQTMRSRTSVSEIGLGELPGISQNGRRQARLAARLRAHHPMHHGWTIFFWMSTASSNKKMPPRAIPLFGAQRSSQTWHAAFPSTYTFSQYVHTLSEWRQTSAQGSAVPRPSRFVPKLVDSAKTTESKMALKFATWCLHCRMVRAATHEKVSAAMLLLPVSMQQPI